MYKISIQYTNRFKRYRTETICVDQGSGNFEIWIGPADDDDVINEPISKKKKYVYINCHEN